jgi:hypothetical protein
MHEVFSKILSYKIYFIFLFLINVKASERELVAAKKEIRQNILLILSSHDEFIIHLVNLTLKNIIAANRELFPYTYAKKRYLINQKIRAWNNKN